MSNHQYPLCRKCWFHQRHLLWSKEDEKEEAGASLEITATAIGGPQGQGANVDGIFQNKRKRQQHWHQRSLGAPFNCDRWFVQSLKKGKYICAIPWFEIWRKHIFPHKALTPLALTVKYLHFNFRFFFLCLAIIYYVEITVTLWGILPTASIVFFCRTYSISLLSGLQRRYCNMSPQHHKPHCFK